MDITNSVTSSGLFNRLQTDSDLLGQLKSLRTVVAALADTTSRTVPNFTDHTVRHMDALWSVADQVLTTDEVARLTTAEAFLVASGFYLHDIGMAFAATPEGLEIIRASLPYRGFMASLPAARRTDPAMEARAIGLAVRALHANAAKTLATSEVPGTKICLFDSALFRDAWGSTCGDIATSHHWSIERVDQTLGSQGVVPLPGGREGDLAYAASVLRLIDYAHINRDRASIVVRAFRQPLEQDSLVHWFAQENIDGPKRDKNELVYRASKPMADVDAWWLYYEMITGLDREIRDVQRMLDRRSETRGRLSVTGVRGATSPEDAAMLIPPANFLPIEVNLRTGSIERLVELLAGESLYGPDPMVAVRELVQNARDAVALQSAVAASPIEKASLSIPISINLSTKSDPPILEIVDHGVGMSKTVMTDFLVSIASDYWKSQFATDFPSLAAQGFKHAGKFGIGFLSVFMLGDHVTVESNRAGGTRYSLSLRGVGRRGELRTLPSAAGSGTAVRVALKRGVLEAITPLAERVKRYAPMVKHPIVVLVDDHETQLPIGWLKDLEPSAFLNWILSSAPGTRIRQLPKSELRALDFRSWSDFEFHNQLIYLGSDWRTPSRAAQPQWISTWPEYSDPNSRLVASFAGMSLICLHGLAVQRIPTPGFVGVINLDAGAPDVSRQQVLDADVTAIVAQARQAIEEQVIENLNAMASDLLVDKTEFVAQCVRLYGKDVLLKSKLPWVSELILPGDVHLLDSDALAARLSGASNIHIAYNTGPWTAMKDWRRSRSEALSKADIALLLDGEGSVGPGYVAEKEKKSGSLTEIWPAHNRAALFDILIERISDAWRVAGADLVQQKGWTHIESRVWGAFSRS